MNNILAIDTSTKNAMICIIRDNKLVSSRKWLTKNNHSIELFNNLRDCCSESSIKIDEISSIYVAVGPGGFSSIRVGISFALGLAKPKEISVLGIPTFEIEFEKYRKFENIDKIVALIPAGLNAYCWKDCKSGDFSDPDGIIQIHEIVSTFNEDTFFIGEDLKNIFENLPSFKYSDQSSRNPENFLKLIKRIIKDKKIADYSNVYPIYSRSPNINIKNER